MDTKEHYFKWKRGGAMKDELIFMSGNPGKTNRLLTKAQMEFERDVRIPMKIEFLTNSLRILKDPGGGTFSGTFDPENPSSYWAWVRTNILGLENGLKAALGNLHGLQDSGLMAQKTASEQAFKDCVMANKELTEQYGDLWDRIASVVEERRGHEARALFQTAGGHGLLDVLVDIVRLCDPAETEEHRREARHQLETWAGSTIQFNFYGNASFVDHIARARIWLPKDDPYFTKVLGGRSGEDFLDLLAPPEFQRPSNWLGYPHQREALVKVGWEAIQESEDPLVIAARELLMLLRKNKKLSAELDEKEEALGAEMANALFACYGTNASPDGTMTLRFTDGVVSKGTTFNGLYARNTEFDNLYPFNLPKIWLDRKDKIDIAKPVNFVSTNDISSGSMVFETNYGGQDWQGSVGNSGSVVVNKKLEVVGMVIDGNIESLQNDFVFRDDVPGAVSVHVDGIMEALVKIYEAHCVAEELTGR